MSEQPETPPETAQQAENLNGAIPAVEVDPAALAAEIAREVRLTLRVTEEVDMRLQVIQIELALVVGLSLLAIVLQSWKKRPVVIPE